MSAVVGQGKADKLVQFAISVPGIEAKSIGLVDEIVETEEELLALSALVMGR
jgi:Delta3-Delta2-enoyl-CoA isomerase